MLENFQVAFFNFFIKINSFPSDQTTTHQFYRIFKLKKMLEKYFQQKQSKQKKYKENTNCCKFSFH